MSESRFEDRLRGYLSAEVQNVEPPGWWDNVIPRLGERVAPVSLGERLLGALRGVLSNHFWRVAIPVGVLAAVVAALTVWQPWGDGSGTQGALARAQAAIKAVQSYRVSLTAMSTEDEQASSTTLEVQFAAPDRYQVKGDIGQNSLEFVLIGDSLYFRDGLASSLDVKTITRYYSSMVSREATARQLKNLKSIVTLPDETVGDTLCLHYRGQYDYAKQLRSTPRGGLPPLTEGEIREQVRQWESTVGSTTIELWIGKNDNLVRRMISQTTKPDNGTVVVSGTDFTFSDFNSEIVVDAPLDKSGELLPGWISTVPESPGFAADIQVEVNNYDLSSRKVNYAISLTNTGKEPLTQVEVWIVAVFPGDPPPGPGAVWYQENSGQDTRGPYIVAPGDSLKYTSTFGYDATSTSPQTVAAKIERAYIEVSYTGLDGQPKLETFHLEVPPSIYTLPTNVPPGFIAVQLEAVGEYTITEKGAISAHSYVQGEIGGQQYLFAGIRTQSMEKPGILVLDIKDPARPRKIGYIGAEGAKYISSATLSGTVLYVQTDSFLWVIDVANPSMPSELGRLTELRPESMVVSGDIAYINDGNHDIVTLDISDPANPVRIGRLPLLSATRFQLKPSGDWLFTTASDAVYCIDATSPASLKIVSERKFDSTVDALDGKAPAIVSPYHTEDFFVTGHRMYVILTGEAGSGIVSLDISDPANPRQAAFLKLKNIAPSGPSFVSGERLYFLAVGGYGPLDHRMRLAIIDISQADKLSEMGYGILPEPWRFFDKYKNEGSSGSFSVVDGYLYWFIGNEPNQPVIEIFELPGK